MEEKSYDALPTSWNVTSLNEEAHRFIEDIKESLNDSHPVHQVRPRIRKYAWWNDELTTLKKSVKTHFSKYRLLRTEEARLALTQQRTFFKRAIRRAKRKQWQIFTSEAENTVQVAKINKIIKAKSVETLGLLQKQGVTCSPSETIDLLMEVHFPGSYVQELTAPTRVRTARDTEIQPYINIHNVKRAIASFGDRKAPGCDGLQPIVLKHLGWRALTRLTTLYHASITLHYVPLDWRRSRVIFIPKPGKETYANPRSFRPITLSSFIVKTLERLIAWELETTTLRTNPLSASQHAFRKGRSTESALSNMMEYIEYALANGFYALGVFLDIQGAFDNIKPSSITAGMQDKRMDGSIIKWYSHYLRNRAVEVTYKGVTSTRRLTLGTPQGGVLSPLMWNLAFEGFLQLYESGPVKCCGYADDAGLIIAGENPSILSSKMQSALDKAQKWGQENGLTFSAAKTVCVLFTRKHKPDVPRNLKMNGENLTFSQQVKYLGITLDAKLSMKPHVETKIKAAKAHALKIKSAMGQLWGINPYLMKWAFTGIIRPALTYGSITWAKTVQQEGIKRSLTRVNRLALLSMGKFRRSTPTAGLEIICDIMPLHLFIMAEASSAYLRTKGTSLYREVPTARFPAVVNDAAAPNRDAPEAPTADNERRAWSQPTIIRPSWECPRTATTQQILRDLNGSQQDLFYENPDFEVSQVRQTQAGLRAASLPAPRGRSVVRALSKAKNFGHRYVIRKHLEEIQFEDTDTDRMDPVRVPGKGYHLYSSSLNKGKPCRNVDLAIYTDGSKIDGKVGSGYCVFRDNKYYTKRNYHLPDTATVFQAEIYAIKKAAEWLLQQEYSWKTIVVHIDSQAAIMALVSTTYTSTSVYETNLLLERVNKDNFLKLRWVKAHVGHEGNELADEVAKDGALLNDEILEDSPKLSYNGLRKQLMERHYAIWKIQWTDRPDCRQTKLWLPEPNRKLSRDILRLDRKTLSIIVQLITGHNYMNYHQAKTDPSVDPECRFCLEDDESSQHIVAECPALSYARITHLGSTFLELKTLDWSVKQVISFLRESHIDRLLDPIACDG
jgi:ribonuclease HI